MSGLDNLREDDSVTAVESGAADILRNIDDIGRVHELLDEGRYEEAVEEIDMDEEELELQLEIMHALANEFAENNIGLVTEIEEELQR